MEYEFQIWDILLKKIDIETGEYVDGNLYSYNGECSGISDDINCSDEISVLHKKDAKNLIQMLQKYIGDE